MCQCVSAIPLMYTARHFGDLNQLCYLHTYLHNKRMSNISHRTVSAAISLKNVQFAFNLRSNKRSK